MQNSGHRIYIFTLVSIVILSALFLTVKGLPYYITPLSERFYHANHNLYKPSGIIGHGLGIIGTLLIIIGVFSYMARKRYRFLSRLGRLKYWLEFHIFLCVLGPIMILFHTAFKFGGIVSISFWSMVVVVASGIIGRYIYLQIPRSMEGRELSLNEIRNLKSDLYTRLKDQFKLDEKTYNAILEYTTINVTDPGSNDKTRMIRKNREDRIQIRKLKGTLKRYRLSKTSIKGIIRLLKNEITLNKKLRRLQSMQRLFKYWHIIHLPFALIMLVIMIIHVAITIAFGAKWIF